MLDSEVSWFAILRYILHHKKMIDDQWKKIMQFYMNLYSLSLYAVYCLL